MFAVFVLVFFLHPRSTGREMIRMRSSTDLFKLYRWTKGCEF
jgi:hypothetical protein